MKKLILSSMLLSSFAIAQPHILIVGTSHEHLGDTGYKTGVWLSELTHAYDEFYEHGANISFASINGDGFPLDPNSLSDMDDSAKNFLLSENKRALLGADNVLSLNQALTQHYDAIYLVGGHGVMWDFKGNEVLDSIIYKTYRSGGVIGAVCHGIAGLLTVKNASGELLIKDKKLTGFSDEEEEAIQLTGVVPFSLEKSLKKSKAQYSQTADNFGSYVVIDQRIVTGQNPASATGVAKGMVNVLSEK